MTDDVLIVHDDPGQVRPYVEDRFGSVRFHYATNVEELTAVLERTAPIAAFSVKCPTLPGPAHRVLVDTPGLGWIHVGGSGFDHLLPLERDDLLVTNCAGVLSPFLAETVLGAIGALNGNFLSYLRQSSERRWQPIPFRPLRDQTLLVVGLGHIGRYVAEYAKALGMRVLATRRTPHPDPAADEVLPAGALAEVIGEADFVSVHLRLDQSTHHLFDDRLLGVMQAGSCLINTSRGAVVDEQALIDALRSGHLRGAYLDVFESEPLPASSPLWSLPNVLITPHAADQIADWPCRFAALFADNLARYLRREALDNQVYPAV